MRDKALEAAEAHGGEAVAFADRAERFSFFLASRLRSFVLENPVVRPILVACGACGAVHISREGDELPKQDLLRPASPDQEEAGEPKKHAKTRSLA